MYFYLGIAYICPVVKIHLMSNSNMLTPNALRNSLTSKQLQPAPRTTNWDAFGVYNQRATMRVTATRARKHGAPVAIVVTKAGTELRYKARTAAQRETVEIVKSSLRDMNGLQQRITEKVAPVQVKAVKVAKLKFTVTKVAKPFRTGESGNKRVTMWKVEAKGIRKYFVSYKAARHFVKLEKAK